MYGDVSKMRVRNEYSEFSVHVVVHQCLALNPLLFIMVLLLCTITDWLPMKLLCVDDLILTAEFIVELEKKFHL